MLSVQNLVEPESCSNLFLCKFEFVNVTFFVYCTHIVCLLVYLELLVASRLWTFDLGFLWLQLCNNRCPLGDMLAQFQETNGDMSGAVV